MGERCNGPTAGDAWCAHVFAGKPAGDVVDDLTWPRRLEALSECFEPRREGWPPIFPIDKLVRVPS